MIPPRYPHVIARERLPINASQKIMRTIRSCKTMNQYDSCYEWLRRIGLAASFKKELAQEMISLLAVLRTEHQLIGDLKSIMGVVKVPGLYQDLMDIIDDDKKP
jgi:hypothetical protein